MSKKEKQMDKLKKQIGREAESLADDLFAVNDFL